MKIKFVVEIPDDSPHRDATTRFLMQIADYLRVSADASVSFDRINDVTLSHEMVGDSHVWAVWLGEAPVWTYTTIEGPMPDALEMWNALAAHLPMHDPDDDGWDLQNDKVYPFEG